VGNVRRLLQQKLCVITKVIEANTLLSDYQRKRLKKDGKGMKTSQREMRNSKIEAVKV